jgi:hypothetical protein
LALKLRQAILIQFYFCAETAPSCLLARGAAEYLVRQVLVDPRHLDFNVLVRVVLIQDKTGKLHDPEVCNHVPKYDRMVNQERLLRQDSIAFLPKGV